MSDEALIDAVASATREEAATAARRLALISEITARWCEDEDTTSAHQVIDGWAQAKAQVSAACNLSPAAASAQMRIAGTLRDRLPRTAALFTTGALSASVIAKITWRTHLVTDAEALALIDTGIAGDAANLGTLPEEKLITALDCWVQKFDPVAVIRSRAASKNLYVDFDNRDDPNGVSSFWGRLRVTDKRVLKQRLDDLADTVCPDDPRTRGELLSAALGSLGFVGPDLQRLACQCGGADCEGSGADGRAAATVVHILTDQLPVAEQGAPRRSHARPSPPEPDSAANATAPKPDPARPAPAPGAGTAVLGTGEIIPAPLLAQLIGEGAVLRPLRHPADLSAEPRYRPSRALADFVRCRALRCMFPGCNRSAYRCDLDHLLPWPAGATHPGNLGPLCREHHLVKTFGGWTPVGHSDGGISWTAPTGHVYLSRPGTAILFPDHNLGTEMPPPRNILVRDDQCVRDAMMPTRSRTRAQDREYRINAERIRNATELALRPTRPANNSDPPPF